MLLKSIEIQNFRGINSLTIPLGKVTVLIGENNTGKSTVLAALQMVLSRGFASRRDGFFNDYDFHLRDERATPQTAEPISIVLHIAEEIENEWPNAEVQYLQEIVSPDPLTGLNHIWLKASGRFDVLSGGYITECSFLNADGTAKVCKSLQCHANLAKYLPVFFLSAIRDAANEFGRRGQFWSGFLKSIQMSDEDRERVEEALGEVNERVISANADLHTVVEQLGQAKDLVAISQDSPVVLEAVPTKVFDLTGRIQVSLKSNSGVKLPLSLHGEGTRSISVLMLFRAFVATLLKKEKTYAEEATPLLLLEEPEAHLHPSAVRSLGRFICETQHQIVLTSHSGDLIAKIPLESICRCYKVNGETKIGCVDVSQFSDVERRDIEYSLREDRGRYLFSRCWLLVEGETDFHIFKHLMEHLNLSEDDINVSILEFSQRQGKGEFFIKLAKMLGIEWFLVADKDASGDDYMQRANRHLPTGEDLSQRALQWTADIEEEFWNNGFDAYIDSLVKEPGRGQRLRGIAIDDVQARKRALIDGARAKRLNGKPGLAEKLVNEIVRRGNESIPSSVKAVIDRVVQLAKG